MSKYSNDWSIVQNDVIQHDTGKFYSVIKGVHGNPVIFQPVAGNVYLTLVGDEVLCEMETVYEDGVTPTQQLRVVRASVANPRRPIVLGEPVLLGEGHSNTQRIYGVPDKFWLVRLTENPDPERFTLQSKRDIAKSKDNYGKAALLMLEYLD